MLKIVENLIRLLEEKRRQKQIDPGTRRQRPGFPGRSPEVGPNDRADGPKLQLADGNSQGGKGRQMARLMQGSGQQEGSCDPPSVHQPKGPCRQEETGSHPNLQIASPGQSMRFAGSVFRARVCPQLEEAEKEEDEEAFSRSRIMCCSVTRMVMTTCSCWG